MNFYDMRYYTIDWQRGEYVTLDEFKTTCQAKNQRQR